MLNFFKDLFQYNDAANRKFIDLFNQNRSAVPRRATELLDHLLCAHHIWNRRMIGRQPDFAIWDTLQHGQHLAMNVQNQEESPRIMATTPLDKPVAYKNSKGRKFTNSARDILFHIINHSTYHRAQLTALLRQVEIELVNTDYIYYKREEP